jgi:predicted MPP superfamily phosphohydrolase
LSHSDPPRRRRRRVLLAVTLAWLFATGAATWLHWWVWIAAPGADGSASTVEGGWPKTLSGLLMMIALPGWGFVSKVLQAPAAQELEFTIASYALGFGLLAAAGLVVSQLRARWLLPPSPDNEPRPTVNLSRRRLLADAPLAMAGLGSASALGSAVLLEPWDLTLASHTVPIRGLASAFHKLRIIQLSDTHLGPRIPASHIRRAVQMALDARPGLIVLTGDYIHNGARYIDHAAALFRPLTASGIPCIGVLGNHDWYGGGAAIRAALSAAGIRMIDNTHTYLTESGRLAASPSGSTLCIAGVGDILEDVVDLDAALAGVDRQTPRLLLSHNPDVAELIGPRRVDLMLCGHTHGGQVRLPLLGTPWVPSRYGSKYAGGLVRGPSCPVVISRGVGMSIMPVRSGVRPEVVEIVLTPA